MNAMELYSHRDRIIETRTSENNWFMPDLFFSHKNHVIWSKLINAGFHTEIWQGRIEKIDSFLFEKIDQNIILRLVAFKLRQVIFKFRQVAFKLRQDAFIS